MLRKHFGGELRLVRCQSIPKLRLKREVLLQERTHIRKRAGVVRARVECRQQFVQENFDFAMLRQQPRF